MASMALRTSLVKFQTGNAMVTTSRQWSSAFVGIAPRPVRVTNTKCITFESLFIAFYTKSNQTYFLTI